MELCRVSYSSRQSVSIPQMPPSRENFPLASATPTRQITSHWHKRINYQQCTLYVTQIFCPQALEPREYKYQYVTCGVLPQYVPYATKTPHAYVIQNTTTVVLAARCTPRVTQKCPRANARGPLRCPWDPCTLSYQHSKLASRRP